MRKLIFKFLTPLAVCVLFLSQVQFAFAQANPQVNQCPPGFTVLCSMNIVTGGAGTVVNIIIIIAIIAALFLLVWGGIRWISSGGDKEKIRAARGTIIAAVVGLVIALSAYFIVNVLLHVFTGGSLNNISVPKLYTG